MSVSIRMNSASIFVPSMEHVDNHTHSHSLSARPWSVDVVQWDASGLKANLAEGTRPAPVPKRKHRPQIASLSGADSFWTNNDALSPPLQEDTSISPFNGCSLRRRAHVRRVSKPNSPNRHHSSPGVLQSPPGLASPTSPESSPTSEPRQRPILTPLITTPQDIVFAPIEPLFVRRPIPRPLPQQEAGVMPPTHPLVIRAASPRLASRPTSPRPTSPRPTSPALPIRSPERILAAFQMASSPSTRTGSPATIWSQPSAGGSIAATPTRYHTSPSLREDSLDWDRIQGVLETERRKREFVQERTIHYVSNLLSERNSRTKKDSYELWSPMTPVC